MTARRSTKPKASARDGAAEHGAEDAAAPPIDPTALALAARTPSICVGTSGFSYTEWRGLFYPDKLPAKSFLRWYAQSFPTTEINNTFYRFPRAGMTTQWRAEVPDSFRFAFKLTQRITHIKRLQDVDREMSWFNAGVLELGPALGPVLVQLPPNFKKDAGRLAEFLARHAPRLPLAVEFRHPSWLDDEIEALLRQHATAFAIVEAEADTAPPPRWVTGPFVYMRLRKRDYAPQELREWAVWMRAQPGPVYCYIKHDQAAPLVARAVVAAVAAEDG